MHSDLFDRIDRTVTEHNMLCPEDRVVAAVSGGADSMLLLHYLLSRRERWQLQITVAHVEHGIRGESSRADAAFVRDFCARQHLSYFEKAIDAPGEAKAAGMGVEAYARQTRYAFFSRWTVIGSPRRTRFRIRWRPCCSAWLGAPGCEDSPALRRCGQDYSSVAGLHRRGSALGMHGAAY